MAYWITSLALIAFGILGMWTIGLPFLLIGAAMVVLGPVRHRPLWFWPPMAALIAYNVALWAVLPFSCSATSFPGEAPTPPTCSSLIGVPWPAIGPSGAAAQFGQTNSLALVVAGLVFVVVLVVLLRKRRSERRDFAA